MNNSTPYDLSVALLHESMLDKGGRIITSSLTLNDIQDIARTATTYGANKLYITHPSAALRKLARRLQYHWEKGYGSTYNTNRKEAIETVQVVSSLDEAIMQIDLRCKKLPKIIATSAKEDGVRTSFSRLREELFSSPDSPYLLLLGTGWGMSPDLMSRADLTLEPIRGSGDFNHLSVRSACAILLDRLVGERSQRSTDRK